MRSRLIVLVIAAALVAGVAVLGVRSHFSASAVPHHTSRDAAIALAHPQPGEQVEAKLMTQADLARDPALLLSRGTTISSTQLVWVVALSGSGRMPVCGGPQGGVASCATTWRAVVIFDTAVVSTVPGTPVSGSEVDGVSGTSPPGFDALPDLAVGQP